MACLPILRGSPPKPPRRHKRDILSRRILLLALLAIPAFAIGEEELLKPEDAFRFTARALGPDTIEAKFTIADGYYLYRDKIHFTVDPVAAGLVAPLLPAGKPKKDQFFGEVQTYRDSLVVNISLNKGAPPGQQLVLKAESQGCADLGICYPPNVQQVTLTLPNATVAPSAPGTAGKKPWFR
jgi:thiol:disulfide interchange protein DsbD